MRDYQDLVWLVMALGAGNPQIWTLLHRYETSEAVREALLQPDASQKLRLSAAAWRRIRNTGDDQVEELLDRCEKLGFSLLWYGDPAYPDSLHAIVNPPALLFARGDLSLLEDHLLLTVVGTRNPSEYSLQVEQAICRDLAVLDFVLATGFAVGCDITANLCAMEQGKPSIAVMGCGLDVPYPGPNVGYKQKIVDAGGLLLSELLPGTSPSRSSFPMRNRILSGISMGTFVVQAPAKSGALITAEYALEQGRDVFCVPPADLFDKRYMGVIKYLRDGAIPVFDSRDIVYEYYTNHAHMIAASALYEENRRKSGSLVMDLEEKQKSGTKPKASEKAEKAKEKKPEPEPVLQTVPPEPAVDIESLPEGLERDVAMLLRQNNVMHVDQIAAILEASAEELTLALTNLELYGALERLPGKQYRLQ